MDQKDIVDIFIVAERLHRQFLDSIQIELDRMEVRDINDVRALMLLNMGDSTMSASDLLWRGCYIGTNVSYNLKKLTEAGYVVQERSDHDRRVVMVSRTAKGARLCEALEAATEQRIAALETSGVSDEDIETCRTMMRIMQRVWAQNPGVDGVGESLPRASQGRVARLNPLAASR